MTGFTEADVRAGANDQSFQRGSSYYRTGAVSDLVRRGNLLTAQVTGSDYAPYRIDVTLLDDGSLGAASCTCPYNWGGYCKHIKAITPEHQAQALHYLRATEIEVALILNFGEKPDFKRLVFDNERKKTRDAADTRG